MMWRKLLRLLFCSFPALSTNGLNGFQHFVLPRAAPTVSSPSPVSPFRRLRHGRRPSLFSLPWPCDSSPRLRAFGGGGIGSFGSFGATNTPIKTRKEFLRRMCPILTGALRQFASGFANGYLLGAAWSVLRGPSLNVESRAMAWGWDFGVLPTLFSCTQGLTELALALPVKGKEGDEGSGGDGNSLSHAQQVVLWSVVLRNMLLAIYFGRRAGAPKMAYSAALYGGLSHLFVRKKLERDAVTGAMSTGNVNGAERGGGQPSAKVMAQALARAMRANGAEPSTTVERTRLFRDNAVDVEFERVVEDDGDSMREEERS